MSLVINNNLMAINASRNLSESFGRLGNSIRRLSSGLRIGTAADDAAGLAIRELMRAEITSMHQGIRNANDAVSLVQTADGALQIIDEKLIRMKELATQAATGTYNSDQRLIIDSEYQAMASEITRIATATEFNGVKLLDEHLAFYFGDELETKGNPGLKVHFGTGNSMSEDYYYINNTDRPALSWWLGDGLGMESNLQKQIRRAQTYIRYPTFQTGGLGNVAEADAVGDSINNHVNQQITAMGADWNRLSVQEKERHRIRWGQEEINYVIENGDTSNGSLSALGLTQSQGTQIGIYGNSGYGSFDGNTIYTQKNAQIAIAAIEKAIVQKDISRANFGTLQNRLENTITNISIQAENLQAAESRISDIDVSDEMTQFVRNQILTQGAVAMLAQANSLPRMALQLMQG